MLIKKYVTDMPEVINPILGYDARVKVKDFERKDKEKISQASIEMLSAFIEARGRTLADPDGYQAIQAHISRIPIYMLFMVPNPPHKNTFLRRRGREKESMAVNSSAYRGLKTGYYIHS